MKRAIIYIGIGLYLSSCHSPAFRPAAGDLFFQVNESSAMADAITASTGTGDKTFSHVAIATGADSVIEATSDGGVRMTAIADFLTSSARIGNGHGVVVMRLKDTTGITGPAVARARIHLGEPYDYSFRPGNGKMYCSELVYESFRQKDSTPLFTARPMCFRNADGNMPPFWTELFLKLGEQIPEGIDGTNPNDMSQEAVIQEVYRYF